jgi:hypothetical protein
LISILVETSKHLAPCAPHKSSDVNQCCLLRLSLALYEVTRPSLRCRSGFVRAPQNVLSQAPVAARGHEPQYLPRANRIGSTSERRPQRVLRDWSRWANSRSSLRRVRSNRQLASRRCCHANVAACRGRTVGATTVFGDPFEIASQHPDCLENLGERCRRPARQSPASPLPSVIVSTKELLRSKFSTLRIRQDFDSLTSE